jgi:ADP-heptose:LPS heptosyltransferase
VVTSTYPHLKLTVLSREKFRPFFEDIPNVQFFVAQVNDAHRGLFGLLALAKQLKKVRIDAVADLHNVIRSRILSSLLKLQGIPNATLKKGRSAKRALTRPNNKVFKSLPSTHQRYADVFERLGYPIDLAMHVFPKKKSWNSSLQAVLGNPTRKIIGVAPYAAFESKVYPAPYIEQVLSSLNQLGNYQIVLFGGGASEEKKLKAWADRFENVVSVAGKFTFRDELALLSNLDVMLAMDSGNGHLAAMMGAPVITLWGVTHPYAGFVPFAQPPSHQLLANREKFPLVPTSIYGNNYPEGYENAIASITPTQVVEKVQSILES